MVYKVTVRKSYIIEAENKEEAIEKFFNRFDLGEEEVDVAVVGKGAKNEHSTDR